MGGRTTRVQIEFPPLLSHDGCTNGMLSKKWVGNVGVGKITISSVLLHKIAGKADLHSYTKRDHDMVTQLCDRICDERSLTVQIIVQPRSEDVRSATRKEDISHLRCSAWH